MNREAALNKLQQELKELNDFLSSLSDEQFVKRKFPEKWTVAENVRHLILAVRPVNLAFSLPGFVVRMFGKPGRPSRSFDELATRYQELLRAGAKASSPFIPTKVADGKREDVMTKFNAAYTTFGFKVSNLPESRWDRYVLPHPILGKITLREMIYFTLYHIRHHHTIIKERI